MIRNERQYRATLHQRRLLSRALDELTGRGDAVESGINQHELGGERDALILVIQRASLTGQLNDLNAQLHDYEQLRQGQLSATRVASLGELPDALVRARIAAGLSQRQLAERLGMKEQQIQRYEADRYAGASLSRLREVIDALGVDFEGDVQLHDRDTPLSRLRKRLLSIGFDRRVVDQRLLRDLTGTVSQAQVLVAAEKVARLLHVPTEHLMSLDLPLPELATTARFDAPHNASSTHLDAYTRYAESLADIVMRAVSHLPPVRPVGDARMVRTTIDLLAAEIAHRPAGTTQADSEILLRALLQYTASIGIPVLALRDPGAFHGACFSRGGRSVIVLKHTSDSAARWLALLLHELDHLADPRRATLRTWIELGDIETWSDSPEEKHAHAFAADVLFYGRADPVLTQAVAAAGGSVERLKAVVPDIATNADVPVDILANYLAFQLTRRGINWWATASGFQHRDQPWRAITDLLLTQIDFNALDPVDRETLMDALAP
jgi:transcriptional regulator with XRE-family HTH domain